MPPPAAETGPENDFGAGSEIARVAGEANSFMWPVEGIVVSSFGAKRDGVANKGIDIRARQATDVLASRDGTVTFVDQLPGFGKTVIVDHQDGFATVYAQLGNVNVHPGQGVSKRQPIARLNDSLSVHFEIRKRQKPQNPYYYLP